MEAAVPAAEPAREFTADARVEMDREAPLVGDRIDYHLEVTLPSGWQLDTPEQLHFVEALRPLREEVTLRREPVDEGVRCHLVIPYVLVRLGRIKLPEHTFGATGPGGEIGAVRAGRLSFHAGSFFANETEPEPSPAFGPLPVVERNWLLIWTLVILGAVLLAVGLTLFVLRRLRPRALPPGPPPRPADEIALEALDALVARNLHLEGEFALYYTELSAILRAYLGGRWGFDSMDMTTTELRERLSRVRLEHLLFQQICVLLDEVDLVKFAKALPTATQADEDMARVRAFVVDTRLRPEPTPPPTGPAAPEGGPA